VKFNNEGTMAIDFLMTFTLSLFFLVSITYAIKDNSLEQSKDLSAYEYELVANDIAMKIEEILHSAERNPEIRIEKEIPLHHNAKTIDYSINVTNRRVKLTSYYEGITVEKPIINNGNIEVSGEIRSSSALALLVYEPETKRLELRNYR